MNWLNYFRNEKKDTASLAKERLKIIVAHQRAETSEHDFLPKLRQELINVIQKYVDIDVDLVNVELERDADHTVLELNITLPDKIASTS